MLPKKYLPKKYTLDKSVNKQLHNGLVIILSCSCSFMLFLKFDDAYQYTVLEEHLLYRMSYKKYNFDIDIDK